MRTEETPMTHGRYERNTKAMWYSKSMKLRVWKYSLTKVNFFIEKFFCCWWKSFAIHLIYISSSSPPPPPSTYQNPSELNLFRFPCFGQKPTTSRPSSNPQPKNSYFHPLCFHFYTFPTGVCWFYLLWSSARPGSRVRFTIQLRAQLEMPTHWFYFLSCTIWTTSKYVSHFLLRLLGLSQDKCVVCNLTQCG